MPVVGTELPRYLYVVSYVVGIYVQKPLGYHHGNDIERITQSLYLDIDHVKAFPENFVTIGKTADNLPHNRYLIVFNNLICHCCSPFLRLRFFQAFARYVNIIYTPYALIIEALLTADTDNHPVYATHSPLRLFFLRITTNSDILKQF